MSAPAPRYIPGQLELTVKAYNTLVENQAFLTPAEFRLGLCIVRRGGHREGVTFSDTTWHNWTGLDPRSKELAAKGLQKKCFLVKGRGQKAVYGFDARGWLDFVHHADRAAKPRTEGRRVDPKPGAQIHSACRERGCALLERESLTLIRATQNAKPVSQTAGCNVPVTVVESGSTPAVPKSLSLLLVAQNAKRVSQTGLEQVGKVWERTLAALQAVFPLVGVGFLARLVAVCLALFADLTDTELSEAVAFAWRQKGRAQKSEGLFLLTVPDAIAALRRSRPAGVGQGPPDNVANVLERARAVIAGRGVAFERHVAALDALRSQWPPGEGFDVGRFEAELKATETAVWNTAAELLTTEQVEQVREFAEQAVQHRCDRRRDPQQLIERIRDEIQLEETFRLLGLVRISL